MTAQTVTGATPAKKSRLNRYDSPWFNRRLITGVSMIGFIVIAGLIGPLVWDVQLALVGSTPLNLPPVWVDESRPADAHSVVVNQTDVTPAVAASPTSSSGFGSSGLGGTGLTSLMSTQTAPAQVAATNTPSSGFGASGLGGTGLTSLMSTQTAPAATPTDSGFGGSGLGGTGLTSLMSTQTSDNPAVTPTAVPATNTTATTNRTAPRTYQEKGVPEHPLGTTSSGRDILAVLILGAPASLVVGVVAALVGLIVSIILGFSSGFLGGWVDTIIRTAADVWLTIPSLAVLLVISAYLKKVDLSTMAILLALFSWPGPTRLIRAQVLTLRERGYIKMAQLSGQSTLDIMFREMLPNLLPYLAASFAGNVSGAILASASLEALGLGPTRWPTLGTTINDAIRATAILRGMWWWWGFPVLTLMFIFTGLFQIAVGLDEIANPRLRGAQAKS
jgi:peptide/nickel transport system permease protein